MKKINILILSCILFSGCDFKVRNVEEEAKQEFVDEIESNTSSVDVDTLQEQNLEELDPIVDAFYSRNTNDKIIFYSDHTGQFFTEEGGCHEFEWSRDNKIVTITYPGLGSDRLTFNIDEHSLTLKTNLYGTIIFY